jgi:hypothetical protein
MATQFLTDPYRDYLDDGDSTGPDMGEVLYG